MPEENGTPTTNRSEWRQERAHVKEALFKLLHGEGLTPARIRRVTPWLVHDFGLSSAEAVRDLILRTLNGLERNKHTQALRNAFGGEGYPKTLKERRLRTAQELGVVATTAGRYEETACGMLADELLLSVGARASMEPQNQGALIAALLGLQYAITKQTAVLQEINDRRQRLGD